MASFASFPTSHREMGKAQQAEWVYQLLPPESCQMSALQLESKAKKPQTNQAQRHGGGGIW